MAAKRITNPKKAVCESDLFSPIEIGFEEKVWQRLCSNESTRKVALVPSEADSRRLVQLLCDAARCGEQRTHLVKKSDDYIKRLEGTSADKLENFQTVAKKFCQRAKPHIDFEIANGNREFNVLIPLVRRLGDSAPARGMKARHKARYWRLSYPKAVYDLALFMERKTGNERFRDLVELLNETAKALGFNQTYDQKSLRDTFRNYLNRRNQEK